MLSAAAVGLSRSLVTLPAISEDITKIAFRFGLVVDQVCRSLEVSPEEINSEGAWVYCVFGTDFKEAQRIVTEFNVEKVSCIDRISPEQKLTIIGIANTKYGNRVQQRRQVSQHRWAAVYSAFAVF